jgi:hypothetical protein
LSDQDLRQAFDALEDLLAVAADHPDPERVAAWHGQFREALATAERGPQWPELKLRGQVLCARLDQRVATLKTLQESVKQEMNAQGTARRALSAYTPSRV